jgi:hypothetical protein
VFAYAPARAEYTRQYLLRHREAFAARLFVRPHIEVVSFGGGPASELVGLVRYLEGADEAVEKINYVVHDKDGEWAEVATSVVNALETEINVEIRYEATDVASRPGMSAIDLSDTDLVIFSYIMSELAKVGRKDQIVDNFRKTLATMKINSIILFIDNLHTMFIQYFRSCKLVTGLMQKNDDDAPVNCDFSDMPRTFDFLCNELNWTPRTDLKSVSKLIVRTKL